MTKKKATPSAVETDRSVMVLGTATAAEIRIQQDAPAALRELARRGALDLADILGLKPHTEGAI